MFKLIRDKVPELIKAEGKVCNYAKCQNKELFIGLLRNKLVEETNEFLSTNDPNELADIMTVIGTFAKLLHVNLNDLYKEKQEARGGFEEQYIGFFIDQPESKGE